MRAVLLFGSASVVVAIIVAIFLHASGSRCVPWDAYGVAPVVMSGNGASMKDQTEAANFAAANRETPAPSLGDITELAESNERFCTSTVAQLGLLITATIALATAVGLWMVRRTIVPH